MAGEKKLVLGDDAHFIFNCEQNSLLGVNFIGRISSFYSEIHKQAIPKIIIDGFN